MEAGPESGVLRHGKERYNKVGFTPVSTSGLRLEVTMQPEWSAGVEKWKLT